MTQFCVQILLISAEEVCIDCFIDQTVN